MRIITSTHGQVVGIHTWTEGFKPLRVPARRLSEAEATAHAAWLEQHSSWEKAAEFIDAWYAAQTRH